MACKGQTDEAIRQYQEALRLKPDYAEAHNNLGIALCGKAISTRPSVIQEALRLNPDYLDAHNNLGTVFYHQSRTTEAIHQFQQALQLKPTMPTPARIWTPRSPPRPMLRSRPAPPPAADLIPSSDSRRAQHRRLQLGRSLHRLRLSLRMLAGLNLRLPIPRHFCIVVAGARRH